MSDLKSKQAQLTVLGLQIETLTTQHKQLKTEVVREMNNARQQLNAGEAKDFRTPDQT